MNKNRASGILLHISSLPSPYGIGTFGKEAYDFIDFLNDCDVKYWQVLPLTVTSFGDSPYQAPSANGLNYYFIDLRILVEKKLLTKKEIDSVDLSTYPDKVDYGKLYNNKIPLLKKAFSRFNTNTDSFKSFISSGIYNDFAFFMTIKEINNSKAWYQFDEKYRTYTPQLEKEVIQENYHTYLFYLWTQYEFADEFNKMKAYAHRRGISLIGDMPLYLAYDSVEVYKYPNLFKLDSDHNPTVVAGVPPDYFSSDGQLWGNPIYNYDLMKKDDFSFLSKRIKNNLEIFDVLRIDHFRGLANYYEIDASEKTARNGKWVKGPRMSLFKDKLDLPIIAEDLGILDDDVLKLLKDTGYPSMKVLQFAFDGKEDNSHKLTNTALNSVTYTGTHDNMPLYGYIKSLDEESLSILKEDVKEQCLAFDVNYLGDTIRDLVLTIDTLCYASPSYLAILPLQDLLAKGKESRMNEPSTSQGNWCYRCNKKDFDTSLRSFIKRNIKRYKR